MRKIAFLFVLPLALGACHRDNGRLAVRGGGLEIGLNRAGQIVLVSVPEKGLRLPVRGETVLEGCRVVHRAAPKSLPGGVLVFSREVEEPVQGLVLRLVDRFTPEESGVRWEVEIDGVRGRGSAPVATGLEIAAPEAAAWRFWTTWGDPDQTEPYPSSAEKDIRWRDPLQDRPLNLDRHLVYGGHYNLGGGFSVPIFSVLDHGRDAGITLALSPEDVLLDLRLRTTRQGQISVTRLNHRLEEGRSLHFSMNFVAHEADWRPALAWMAARYPAFFEPSLAAAPSISGCGAYSSYEGAIDVEKFKRMGGIVNWKASFDFPYMGLFLPPVPNDAARWRRFDVDSAGRLIPGKKTYTSIAQMEDYARRMKRLGFSTLAYFNVTEFGGASDYSEAMIFPRPGKIATDSTRPWTNPNWQLYENFRGAILFGSHAQKSWGGRTREEQLQPAAQFHEAPMFTWGGAMAVDCGDPAYQDYLLEQARRHVEKLPDIAGICIDRTDWLAEYNWKADDGVSLVGGRPVRSLFSSWKALLARLGPLLHGAGKAVFCNPHLNRLELVKEVDGIYNEFGHIGFNMNLSAYLTLFKPFLAWTPDSPTVLADPDEYFQRHLYLGAFPTAPFPGNDHTIGPDPAAEKHYLDYGPLLAALKGRRWILEPHIVEAREGNALVNIFRVGDEFVLPVVRAKSELIRIRVAKRGELVRPIGQAWVRHPGGDGWREIPVADGKDFADLTVPVVRVCALARLRPR